MDTESTNNLESNGHTLNGSAQNGVTTQINDEPVKLGKTDQDIVRLIGQYLKIVGLRYVFIQIITTKIICQKIVISFPL